MIAFPSENGNDPDTGEILQIPGLGLPVLIFTILVLSKALFKLLNELNT